MNCAIPFCQMTKKYENPRSFMFPKNKNRRKIWLTNSNLVTASAIAKLCEAHFDESQFEEHGKGCLKKLKPNAVPTLFSWNMTESARNQTVKSSDMFVPFKKKRKRFTSWVENYDYGYKRQCASSESKLESDSIDYFDKVQYSSVEDTESTCGSNVDVHNKEMEYELQQSDSVETLKPNILSSDPVVWLERLNEEELKSYLVNEEISGSEVDSENKYVPAKIIPTNGILLSPSVKDYQEIISSVKESFQEESASDKKQSVTPLQCENKTVFVSEDSERTGRLSLPIILLHSTCQLNYRKKTYILPIKDVKSNYPIANLKWTNKLLLDDRKIFEKQYKIVNSKKKFLLQQIIELEKKNAKMRCESEKMQQIMVKYKKHNQTLWQKLLMIENDKRRKQRRHENEAGLLKCIMKDLKKYIKYL